MQITRSFLTCQDNCDDATMKGPDVTSNDWFPMYLVRVKHGLTVSAVVTLPNRLWCLSFSVSKPSSTAHFVLEASGTEVRAF